MLNKACILLVAGAAVASIGLASGCGPVTTVDVPSDLRSTCYYMADFELGNNVSNIQAIRAEGYSKQSAEDVAATACDLACQLGPSVGGTRGPCEDCYTCVQAIVAYVYQ